MLTFQCYNNNNNNNNNNNTNQSIYKSGDFMRKSIKFYYVTTHFLEFSLFRLTPKLSLYLHYSISSLN